MDSGVLDELLTMVRREIGAVEARIVATPAEFEAPFEIALPIEGRLLVVRFAEAPADADAVRTRLELLLDGFGDLVARALGRASRPPPAKSLREALDALAERAGARDAVVIDARSPIVWGSAGEVRDPAAQVIPYSSDWRSRPGADELLRVADRFGVSPTFEVDPDADVAALLPRSLCRDKRIAPLRVSGEVLDLAMVDPGDVDAVFEAARASGLAIEPFAALPSAILAFANGDDTFRSREDEGSESRLARAEAERDGWARHLLGRRAIPAVRALPEIASLSKGAHLHHVYAEPGFGYAAHSFAGIYVLVLVFDRMFDELGVRRATVQALPTIERLVLSLPPRDPNTRGGAVALRARLRRRR